MAQRKPPSTDVEADVLLASRRRCCICYGLHRDLGVKQGQLAHINRDPSDSDADNLAFMCLEHHDWFDTKTSQSKGASVEEARRYRAELYSELRRRDEEDAGGAAVTKGAEQAKPKALTPAKRDPPVFKPIDVIDERLNLRWIIRVAPKYWLDQQDPVRSLTPAEVMRFLDGPFHAAPDCQERLEEAGGGSGYGRSSPFLRERCPGPGCNAELFRTRLHSIESRYIDAWTVRAQALAELQRMHRGGIAIEGPRLVLKRPQYWSDMLPTRRP